MQGSLCLHRGVLWVGRHELTAHVRPFDLDGHPLGEGFSFRGEGGAPASAAGIAASGEHTLWIAETSGGRVQGFNVFGRETRALGRGLGAERDAPGSTAGALDVAVLEEEDEPARIVACFEGERRHGVQVFDPEGPWIESLRSEGSPLKTFTDARRLGVQGRLLYVCERRAGRVQVFRDGDFHFAFRVAAAPGHSFEPAAIEPLEDGNLLIATGGAASSVLLTDSTGRVLRVLAEHGEAEGQVFEPNDLAAEPVEPDAPRRFAVIDRDAERVQVLTLDGRCYGSFEGLPGDGHRART